jgi:hypothetical protein
MNPAHPQHGVPFRRGGVPETPKDKGVTFEPRTIADFEAVLARRSPACIAKYSAMKCHHCNKNGHLQSECPTRRATEKAAESKPGGIGDKGAVRGLSMADNGLGHSNDDRYQSNKEYYGLDEQGCFLGIVEEIDDNDYFGVSHKSFEASCTRSLDDDG